MKKENLYTLVLLSAFGLSGCAPFQAGNSLNLNAPSDILRENNIDNIDLYSLVRSYACAEPPENKICSNYESPIEQRKYDALKLFHSVYGKDEGKKEEGRIVRNNIYDILTTSADKNCKKLLVSLETYTTSKDILSGSVGAITGALGALTGSTSTKSALSAVSGVTHGIDATWDEAVLRNRTFDIIISGINMARRDHDPGDKEEIKSKPLKEYSLERAIKDANAYSNACDPAVAMDTVKTYLATGGKTDDGAVPGDNSKAKAELVKKIKNFDVAKMRALTFHDVKRPGSVAKGSETYPKESDLPAVIAAYTGDILIADMNRYIQLSTLVHIANQ